MTQTARSVALDALLKMDENEGYSNIVIDKALKVSSLDKRDSALASAIFYGVLEKRITLDHFIRRCLTAPDKKLDITVLNALRCAAYQIIFLDRIPDSAAVNETVSLLKACGKTKYAGFANGVLRTFIRNKDKFILPQGSSLEELSIRYSVPKKLIKLWQVSYGEEITEKILGSSDIRPETFIRINNLKISDEDFYTAVSDSGGAAENIVFPPRSAVLKSTGDKGSPAAMTEFEDGLFHVQDLSAQIVCSIVDPKPDELVYDCCAAPGGKSFTMAEMMDGKGKIIAFDLYKGRVKLISDGAKRLGIENIIALQNDMTKSQADKEQGDKVLCDVPCSGFGVIRRKPEIRYKDFKEVNELPELQYEILKNASALVKKGGVLVYSTCTLNKKENGDVADRFLAEEPDFEPAPIDIPAVPRVIDEPENQITMMPFSGASDGFFAAKFRKKI